MEDNDNNLEQFFNRKFAQNMDAEPWNTPPGDVWTGIEAEVQKKAGREKWRGLLIPLLFLGMCIFSGGYFYWQHKTYERRLNELEIQLKACGAKGDRAISSSNPANPENQPIIPVASGINTVGPEAGRANSNSAQYPVDKTQTQLQPVTSVPIINSFKTPEFNPVEPQRSDTATSKVIVKTKRFGAVSNIPLLFSPKVRVVHRPFKILLYPNKPDRHNYLNGLWQLGAVTEAMLWRDRTKGELVAPLSELLEKETVSNTIAYGVVVKKAVTKHWSLDAGLLYGDRESTSDYLLNVPYTLATEHSNPDGSLGNEFAHTLPSGLGNINTFLVLNRSANSTVVDKEEISLDFAYRLKTRSLFVPIKLTFYPTKVGSGLYAAVGLNNEFGLKNSLSVIAAKSLHSEVHEKSIDISLGDNRQRNYTIQATMNIGYQLPISSSLGAVFNVGYNRALIDRFSATGYGHKLDNWAIGLAINRSF